MPSFPASQYQGGPRKADILCELQFNQRGLQGCVCILWWPKGKSTAQSEQVEQSQLQLYDRLVQKAQIETLVVCHHRRPSTNAFREVQLKFSKLMSTKM